MQKKKGKKREEPKIELQDREVFWYSRKPCLEDKNDVHIIKSSTITKNLEGIESREYSSYCGKDIFSWYHKGYPELKFGIFKEANEQGLTSCKKCLENLAETN